MIYNFQETLIILIKFVRIIIRILNGIINDVLSKNKRFLCQAFQDHKLNYIRRIRLEQFIMKTLEVVYL